MYKILKLLFTILVPLFSLAACDQTNSLNLSEKPPISVIPHMLTTSESTIQTLIRVPLGNLQQKLENDIPEVLYNSEGKEKQKCVRIFGKNHCEEFRVGGWAKRTGPIQLQALNNGYMRIKIPVSYKLKATANGKLIRNLLKSVKFKQASFTVIADLLPNIDNNWQLKVRHTSKISWQKSPMISVLGIKVSVQELLEKSIEKALDKALSKQANKLAADSRLKAQINKFWREVQQPRKLSNSLSLWLQVTPRALYLSNIHIKNNALLLGLALKTNLQATHTDNTVNKTVTDAPAPIRQAIKSSNIYLSLPLKLSYQQLEESIKQSLLKKPVQLEQNDLSVMVNDVGIYPNNDRLVLASKITIKGFKGWLSSDGEVYVSGRLVVDNTNHVIRLVDVEFSRKLDSPFWTTATKLLQKQLLQSLQESLVYDFSEDYQAAYESVNAKLKSKKSGKLTLHGQLNSLKVKNIYPELEELHLVLEARGAIDFELNE